MSTCAAVCAGRGREHTMCRAAHCMFAFQTALSGKSAGRGWVRWRSALDARSARIAGLKVEDDVDGGGELVVAGEAVEEVLGGPVVADLGADLEIPADLTVGHRRDRQPERRLERVL